jgi:hypothetical protein
METGMTVSELIAKLKAIESHGHGDYRVVIPGYEGGYSDIHELEGMELALNVRGGWYYGPHDEWGSHRFYGNAEKGLGVLLRRAPNPNKD